MLWRLSISVRKADAIQVRCPGNLGLLGVILAPLFSRYRVAKYAGQWNGYQGESFSNRLQRFILASSWWNSPVLVYGNWPAQPRHIKPFFTSMMSQEQVDHAVQVANARQSIGQPLHLLYSGRLVREKRVHVLIDAMKILEEQGVAATLKLVGDGPARQELEDQARSLQLDEKIRFEGSFPYEQALQWNEWADCLLLASRHSEGWPKVVAEAMCYGVIPIATQHGQLAEMLDGRGILLENGTPEEFASAITNLQSGMSLKEMQKKVSGWASQYSLPAMKRALQQLLIEEWKLTKSEPSSEGL
jgi:glycosyltransferase involved in cell wall biosynthesis